MLLKHYLGQFADLKPNRSGGRVRPHLASLIFVGVNVVKIKKHPVGCCFIWVYGGGGGS